MKYPKNVPIEVFDFIIEHEILSLSYLIRKFKMDEERGRKILRILSKLFEYVQYDEIGPIRIKTCENPKKMINSEPPTTILELDEYLKSMCKGKKRSRLYDDTYSSSQCL